MVLRRIIAALTVAVIWIGSQQSANAQVGGISYTLTPVLERVFFKDDAALKDALLYGGRLGFGFGQYVELNGLYVYGQNIGTDLGGISSLDAGTVELLAGLPGRDVKLHRYGGDIKFNIGRGSWFPFVTAGSGVLRFEPDGLSKTESIYLSGGIGLQFSFRDRYTLVAQANSLSYRYNPASAFVSDDDLATLGLIADDSKVLDVNNISASIGVQFYLGGRTAGELTDLDRALERQMQRGIRGVALRIEPTAGEVDFSEALGLRHKQRFAGVSAGIDLGPLVSLRGFYWRGARHDAWTNFEDIQAYGGEMKFTFNEARGSLTPYLLVGGGYMDVMSGYVGNGLVTPEDRPFAMGGVGVVVPMGEALNLDVGLRSLLLSSEDTDNVSSPGQVETNTMFSVGLSFGIGGGGESGGVFGREAAASRTEREQLAAGLSLQEKRMAETRAELDSLRAVVAAQEMVISRTTPGMAMPAAKTAMADTSQTTAVPGAPKNVAMAPAGGARNDRWVTLPIPEEGELYLRFGSPGGVSVETITGDALTYYLDPATGKLIPAQTAPTPGATGTSSVKAPGVGAAATPGLVTPTAATLTPDQVAQVVRDTLARERSATAADSVAARAAAVRQAESLERLERALDQRMSQMESRIDAVSNQRSAVTETPAAQVPSATVTEKPAARREPAVLKPVRVSGPSTPLRLVGLDPMIGFNIDDPNQFLLGLRGEFTKGTRPFRLLPEFVLGFGEGDTSWNLNLNGAYDLNIGLGDRFYPYGGLGIGFLDLGDAELVFNVLIGTHIRTTKGSFFAEYMAQDFDNHRLFTGYRVGF